MPKDETKAEPVVMAMTPEEFAELRAAVATIGQSDVQLGRVLSAMLLHLGHAHDLDPTVEDAKAAAAAKEAEDAAALKAEEDAKALAAEQAAATPVQEGNDNAS